MLVLIVECRCVVMVFVWWVLCSYRLLLSSVISWVEMKCIFDESCMLNLWVYCRLFVVFGFRIMMVLLSMVLFLVLLKVSMFILVFCVNVCSGRLSVVVVFDSCVLLMCSFMLWECVWLVIVWILFVVYRVLSLVDCVIEMISGCVWCLLF